MEHESKRAVPGSSTMGLNYGGLDVVSLNILKHVREQCGTITQLLENTSKTTLYRKVTRLLALGLLRKRGNEYLTTESGRMSLDRSDIESRPGSEVKDGAQDTLSSRWPFLGLFPTAVHRALVELLLFARISRRDSLTDDHHPGFVLIGPTQRLKSWVIKAACILLGSSPDRCRVPMMQVRGRGLLARLDSKGSKVYQSQTIKEVLLWGEEFSLADSIVKRDVEALLHGTKEIRVENEYISVEAIPVFEMNPKKKEGTLEERTGLDTPRIRRSIVCDFTGVHLQSRQKADSPSVLEKIKKAAPANLPTGKSKPGLLAHNFTEHAFERCVKPENMDWVDPGRVLGLIAGAMALLPEQEASHRVLSSYFTVAETTCLVRPDWRARLMSVKPKESRDEVDPKACSKEPPVDAHHEKPLLLDPHSLYQRWRKSHGQR